MLRPLLSRLPARIHGLYSRLALPSTAPRPMPPARGMSTVSFSHGRQFTRKMQRSPWVTAALVGIPLLGAGFILTHLEETEYTHRTRFIAVSPERELAMGLEYHKDVVKEAGNLVLPASAPRTRMVARVASRIIAANNLKRNIDWEVTVVDKPIVNAFVVPGGKIVVYTGIIDVISTTKDPEGALAAILAHEVAHVILRHGAENVSWSYVISALALATAAYFGISPDFTSSLGQLAFSLPHSRAAETEADVVGAELMARACYSPVIASELWHHMDRIAPSSGFALLRTHPTNADRAAKLQVLYPQVQPVFLNCAEAFRHAIHHPKLA
ncbi:metalloendopeptidase OMA1 [Thecamonas trahens ATCC 50062]|uniref:Metalloendopeptidase OMA1 n=1 Tax=Thecamonas trahens ATCC 50062 TaxID=461836 RepID=A0A0L0DCQ2_THETB|nr:metalloendopeptidase OMA1 [Thecamonas trahens ATCC 50062]KNC50102.1 metalloendopeptidase OMA1 [Thecamonas trahens ATCC 50062]|eukprot:XP_013757261.1 metalloendopeptidase OMA1 [Thecamonas trahens ATCC 50062]